jgi:hypothetical protein
MLDHPLDRPRLRALRGIEPGIEIETVFALDMGADEGLVRDHVAMIIDIGHLPLGRGIRQREHLAVWQSGHLELYLGLGDEGADFRQAETFAKPVENDHRKHLS